MSKSSLNKTPFIVGLPVPPNQFFGRREQVEQFFRQCISGPVLQPTRILGLKRSGKTSFLNYISHSVTISDFLDDSICSSLILAYVNAQYIHSPAEFYEIVTDAVQAQLADVSIETSKPRTGRAFQRWLTDLIHAKNEIKIIVLIDEFEKLHDTDEFDMEFFGFLRALASAYSSQMTWVTASAVDLYTLDEDQKTSPFWNIFHQMPVIMGGFSEHEVYTLIHNSLESIGETISDHEIEEILSLSGNIPYFVQAVADAWHSIKRRQAVSTGKISDEILNMLSSPGNQIQHIYKRYWKEMDKNQRAVLKNIASERRGLTAAYSDLTTLSDFGLLTRDDVKYGGYRISGKLLKQFIIEVSDDSDHSDTANEQNETEYRSGSSVVVVEVDRNTHVHTQGGAYISGHVNTGGGNIGRDDHRKSGIGADELEVIFESLFREINNRTDLENNDKADLISEIDELRKELSAKEQPDESFLMRRLRNIERMAPDILDVVLTTITNPVAGFGTVAKKVAEKIKASAG